MSNVRLPIKTNREGNEITKICVEDIHKMTNRVYDALDKAYFNSVDILDNLKCSYYDEDSKTIFSDRNASLVIGTGRSKPCLTDAFDEEIGNDIAFMKAKLNANIKKHNLLVRIWNELEKAQDNIDEDLEKIDNYILDDLERLRSYNSSYLNDIEYKLGILSREEDEV